MRTVERWRDGEHSRVADSIAEEVPVALAYNGDPFAVMMMTPCDLEDFALGFSLTEGLITHPSELLGVKVVEQLEGIELALAIPSERAAHLATHERTLEGRSGCGVCGSRRLENIVRHYARVGADPAISAAQLHDALTRMRAMQALNRATGATHAAAWVALDGAIVALREDVGRHNALDKLIGVLARAGFDPNGGFLLLTSRASYEMVMKAASAGIALVAAVSGATAMAVHLAESSGITLIGYARPQGCTVYSHAQRFHGGNAR
jgi:FdhD protein